jgi:hypothetical protein
MASTNQIEAANALLQVLNSKMICAIDYTLGYATKAAFFEHCSKAITDMGVPTEVLREVIMQRKIPHKARHKLPVLIIGNNENSILCTPDSKL